MNSSAMDSEKNKTCHKKLLAEYSENYDNVQKMVSNEINNLEFVMPNCSELGVLSKSHLTTVLRRVRKIRSTPLFMATLFAVCIDSFTCMIKSSSFYTSYLYDNKINKDLILQLLSITYMEVSNSSDISIESLSSFIAILNRSAKRLLLIDASFYEQLATYIMRLEMIRTFLIDNKIKTQSTQNSISENQKLLGVSNNLKRMAPVADDTTKTFRNHITQLNSVQPSITKKNAPVAFSNERIAPVSDVTSKNSGNSKELKSVQARFLKKGVPVASNNFITMRPDTNGASKHSKNHKELNVKIVLKKSAPVAGVHSNVEKMAPVTDSTDKNSGNHTKELNSAQVLLEHKKNSIFAGDTYFDKIAQKEFVNSKMEKNRKKPFKQPTTNQMKITDFCRNYNNDIREQYDVSKRSMEKEIEFNRKENIQPPRKMMKLETCNEVQSCSLCGKNKKCV